MTLAEELIKKFKLVRYEQPEGYIGKPSFSSNWHTNERATGWYHWMLFEAKSGNVYFCLELVYGYYSKICRITDVEQCAQLFDNLGIELKR